MLPETWTILRLLKWTTAYFKSRDIEQPRVDAEVLLSHALGVSRVDLYVQYDRPLQRHELDVFRGLIQRRVRREPVAYIVGDKEFWSLVFKVTPDVLIPRPETECLVETALKIIPEEITGRPWRVLDLGTGSGAIVLALASERPGHDFYAVDRSERALAVARTNGSAHQLDECVTWLQGDWFRVSEGPIGSFDVIVSNPPYIRTGDFRELLPEISRYEPHDALDGGADGLVAIRHIVRDALDHLAPGGRLVLEIGHDQRSEVQALIRGSGGYDELNVVRDYSGYERVVCARAKPTHPDESKKVLQSENTHVN